MHYIISIFVHLEIDGNLNFVTIHKFPLGKTSQTTTIRMKSITTEASIISPLQENTKADEKVIPDAAEEVKRHNTLAEENVYVGLMFGSKALVQLVTNPWIGPLTNKLASRQYFFITFISLLNTSNMKFQTFVCIN